MSQTNNQPPSQKQGDQQQQAAQPGGQLPDPADMFQMANAQNQQLMETPSRVYNNAIRLQQRAVAGLQQTQQPNDFGPATATAVNNMMASPIQSNASTAGPKTLLASAYRAGEVSEDRRQVKQGTTLVPNFRSLSPSIFNIDLNQTGERQAVQNGPGGQSSYNATAASHQQQQNQHIYVSIQPKRTEGGGASSPGTGPGHNGNAAGSGSNMRIKRVGPINKGDKIKFGVIVAGAASSKRKNQSSAVDQLERHEIFETPNQMSHKTRLAIGKHSDAVNREVMKFPIYTTTRTLPTALINAHTNIIKQFKTNFTRETDTYSKYKLNSSASGNAAAKTGLQTTTGGYLTDSETLRTKANALQKGTPGMQQRTAVKMSKKSWFSEDGYMMSIRDVIEEHAKSVAALNKSFRPNIHLEIDEKRKRRNKELEEKGRKIAEKLNLSVQSCTTKAARMYRCLTDEQPIRQHNKPLTHLMRPSDKLIIERRQRKEEDRRKVAEEDRLKLKRRSMEFSMQALTRDFKKGLSAVSQGQTRMVDLKEQKRYIEDFRHRKLSNLNDGWERQRKEIEESIDNGMTYSHLSRSYPMKREWAKYLVLLRKKEKDRRKKEKKIQEIVEDLHEKGVTDEKVVTKELDMFEYMEFKKKRDRSKARMGAKAEVKYYRPVDTERTLKIEKISLNMSDDYDDGPGGFQIEDFAGIETMFSKQSLEQRRLRIDRARERLRQKRIDRIEDAKRQKEEELKAQIEKEQEERKQRLVGRSSMLQSRTSSLDLEAVQNDSSKPSILEQVSKSKETQNAMQFAVTGETGLHPDQKSTTLGKLSKRYKNEIGSPPLPSSKKGLTRHARPPKIPKASTGQSIISSKIEVPHPAIIEDSQQQESSAGSDGRGTIQHDDVDVFSKATSGPIRVEIASASGHRNISNMNMSRPPAQPNAENMKTQSQMRDYSLEDGGIFEKKTANANTSIEEAKIGESLTHRSYELLAQGVAQSVSSIDKMEAQSQQEIKQKFIETAHESVRLTNETLQRGALDREEVLSNKDTEELNEDGEVQLMEDSKDQERLQQVQNDGPEHVQDVYGTAPAVQQQQQRVRPSTTENTRRNIMKNRRRQLMSGQQNQQFEQLRTSAPNAENARFGRYPAQNEKSAGVITTVYQQQLPLRTMMNHDSSDQQRFQLQQTQLAATTTSGFVTENAPQGTEHQSQKMLKGAITLADRSPQAKNMQDYVNKMQRSTTKTHSGATLPQTADDLTVQAGGPKIAIWKQLMKLKEEEGLSGSEHLSRAQILRIRSKARRDRIRVKKRTQKLERKMTSMGLADSSRLGNSMTMKSSNMNLGLSPFRPQSREDMHRTQTMAGLHKTDSSMVEIQDYTFNQRKLQDNTRNAGVLSNEEISTAQQFNMHQFQLTQGVSDTQFATQPYQNPMQYFSQDSPGNQEQRGVIDEATSSSYIPTTTQMLSSNLTPNATEAANKLQLGQQEIASNEGVPMQGKFALGFHQVATEQRNFSALSLTESDKLLNAKDFVEINRTCVRANSLKKRLASHLGRVRNLRSITRRRKESLNFQANLSGNMSRSLLQINAKNNLGIKVSMKNQPLSLARLKTTAKMQMLSHYASAKDNYASEYPSFQNQLDDRRSMKVFQNTISVDPEIQNEFTRNQAWNQTLNCPYYGLMNLRRTQEMPINSQSKAENILRPFTTGTQVDRLHCRKVKSAVKHRNELREMDGRIYSLIDLCQKSAKIEWKSILKDNEEFRNTGIKQQMKKNEEKKEDKLDDLLELKKI